MVAVLNSLYPVVTIGLARVYLHERIERLQQIGIATVLCGVVAISGAAGSGFAEIDPQEAEQRQVSMVGIEGRLTSEDQKRLTQRARGGDERYFSAESLTKLERREEEQAGARQPALAGG